MPTLRRWATSLLDELGIQPNPQNVRGVVGWARAEGGHFHNTARFNPLNTTQPMPGAGNTGTQGNIKVYRDWSQGLKATVRTLENGLYGNVLSALRHGNAQDIARAVGSSPWGTSGSLVSSVVAGLRPIAPARHPLAGAKPSGGASGGGSGPSGGRSPVQGPPAPMGLPAGSTGIAPLLQALAQQKAQPQSMGLQAPSFAAQPTLAGGGQVPMSGGPAPKLDTAALLSLAATQGGDVANAPGGTGSSTARGGSSSTGGGGGAAPVVKGHGLQLPRAFSPTHQTSGLPGFPARDIFGRPGEAVRAPVSGKIVKLSGRSPSAGAYEGQGGPFGWSIYIQGENGHLYFLTHFGSRNVKVGQRVRRGQVIGRIGNYPGATPDHIHEGRR